MTLQIPLSPSRPDRVCSRIKPVEYNKARSTLAPRRPKGDKRSGKIIGTYIRYHILRRLALIFVRIHKYIADDFVCKRKLGFENEIVGEIALAFLAFSFW